ncbi:MAG: type III-A CRISPR-associated RAMP protein Csm4 [Deltaproteobacteria bacterium]|nr:type III-A CRISPR-associated RAMP protein Csm4 [Deltaproteobacteria bacterium]MBW2065538.1 type III-A CRISPR-associated RAMP protein Csm4 [Deltaproteobacteria bacterium]
MDNTIAYKLNFHSPLHIAAHGIGYEQTEQVIHSDTLFSSIMTLWPHFYPEDDVESLCQEPPFILSSAFPFKGQSYFFPRPFVKIGKRREKDGAKVGKKIKDVKYVSLPVLESILQGKGEELEFRDADTFQDGKFWDIGAGDNPDYDSLIFAEREVPRVTIDRHSNASEIFYFSELVFEKDAGLFFLAKFLEKGARKKLEAVLRLLGDEGIGGDKRAGKGLFHLEIAEDFKVPLPPKPDSFVCLSLYYPKKEEFKGGILGGASYNLVSRSGWIHVPGAMSLKRKSVRMFSEGSVFGSIGKSVYGENPRVLDMSEDLGLKHNIYRYGTVFTLPMVKENSA